MKFDFTIYLGDSPELTDGVADALFSAGCDDGSPGMCNGVVSIDFHREAATLDEAIRSAIENVESAGYKVARVEIEAEGVSALREPAA
jgi:hypothetical protein